MDRLHQCDNMHRVLGNLYDYLGHSETSEVCNPFASTPLRILIVFVPSANKNL